MVNNEIRLLDIDDLIILSFMFDGAKHINIARSLGLTPPAICHRIAKFQAMEPSWIEQGRYGRRLSAVGIRFAVKAKKALKELNSWQRRE